MNAINKLTVFLVSIVFLGWGFSVFFDKLAATRMGNRGSIVYLTSMAPAFLVLAFFYFWGFKMWNFDRTGIMLITVSSFFNIIALAAYYFVFTKTEASWAVAVTALYPILTITLAFIFLHETVTIQKIIGIVLAMVALVFLGI